jgi:hypothetical protein
MRVLLGSQVGLFFKELAVIFILVTSWWRKCSVAAKVLSFIEKGRVLEYFLVGKWELALASEWRQCSHALLGFAWVRAAESIQGVRVVALSAATLPR